MCGYHCTNCGKCRNPEPPIPQGVCIACKTTLNPDATVCPHCGAPVLKQTRRPAGKTS